MDWGRYGAALFDLDGVVTPTAEVHMRAWSTMFNTFLEQRRASDPAPGEDLSPYTDTDYFTHVDGRPRYDGVRSFLESRGIRLPEGDPADPPEAETVAGLGNRKNAAFGEVLATDGVAPYPGSATLLAALTERGLPMAIVSSSRNAPAVLEAAGLTGYFGTVMHGGVAAERGLAGKPAPDTFIAAAADLGVPTTSCVVLEDAVSGVAAGAAGDFGLVVGVDRANQADALRAHGAESLLVSEEEIRREGTVYTPRPVVQFMCREALVPYLERELAVDEATARRLIVDDEAEPRQLLARVLRKEGYDVEEASGGGVALLALSQRNFDLVLTDLSMPGLSGWEVARRLRQHPITRGLPIIVVSALARPQEREAALHAGCDAYLSKPFLPDELARVVTTTLMGERVASR